MTTGGWLGLESGQRYTITLKRRAGVVGLLVDHRLIGIAPVPFPNPPTPFFPIGGKGLGIGGDGIWQKTMTRLHRQLAK